MNIRMTLVLARVQMRLRQLEPYAEEFIEAKDVEPRVALIEGLKVFIIKKSGEEEVPADPLEFVRAELEKLNHVFGQVQECLTAARSFGAELTHPKPKSLSAEKLANYPVHLKAAMEQMDQQLDDLCKSFPFDEWGIEGDVPPEVMWIAEKLSSYMSIHKMPRKELLLFMRRGGPFYAEVDKHFAQVGDLIEVFEQRLEQQRNEFQHARDELEDGNFRSAKQRLDKMDRLFSDIDYETLLGECVDSTKPLEEAGQRFQEMRLELLMPMKVGLAGYFLPALVKSRYAKRHKEAREFQSVVMEFQQQTAANPASDLAKEVELFERDIEKQCAVLHGEINEVCQKIMKRSWRHLAWLGMGLLVGTAIYFSISAVLWERQRDVEAWEHATGVAQKAGMDYEKAKAGYEEYVRGHPRGSHVEEASTFIKETLPMKMVERERQIEQQRRQYDENDWQKANALAKAADTQYEKAIEGYQVYLKDHPRGIYLKEATAFIEKILPGKIVDREWRRTADAFEKAANSQEAWDSIEAFLKKYPGSTWNVDALKLRDTAGSRIYQEIAKRGQEALRAGDWKQAYAAFAQAINFNPGDPLVLSLVLKYKPYEFAPGTSLGSFSNGKGSVATLVLGPGGKLALVGHQDGTISLWNLLDGREIRAFKGRISAAGTCAFSPDGKTALSGTGKTDLHLWDVASGSPVWVLPDNAPRILHTEVTPDGKFVLCAMGKESVMRLYDMANGKDVRDFLGHTDVVNSLSMSADGKLVFSGGNDCFPRLWDFVKGKPIRSFKPHLRPILSVSMSQDGKIALSASKDGTVKIWNLATGADAGTLPIHGEYVMSVALSPEGRFALGGNRDGSVSFWDVVQKKEIMLLKGHTDIVNTVRFSPDGSFAISGSRDGTFKLWSIWDSVRPPPAMP